MTTTFRRLPRALGAAALTATLLGCSVAQSTTPTTTPGVPNAATEGSCPKTITLLVDTTTPAQTELNGKFDKTKSMIDTPTGLDRLETQVRALAGRAVDGGSALRLSVFTGSLATVTDVLVCPTLAVKYNNDKAKSGKVDHLADVVGDEAWAAVRDTVPAPGGKGSSVAGAWIAFGDDPPLAPQRRAVMVSDGRGPREDTAVDLSGYRSVGMYAVGRVAGRADTTRGTADLVDAWRTWLTHHHAEQLTVTSKEFQ